MQRWIQSIALWFKEQLDLERENRVVAYAPDIALLILVDLALLVLVCWFLGVLKKGLLLPLPALSFVSPVAPIFLPRGGVRSLLRYCPHSLVIWGSTPGLCLCRRFCSSF